MTERTTHGAWWFMLVVGLGVLAGCGGSDDESSSPSEDDTSVSADDATDGEGGSSAGSIVDAPPSGQASASVDGLDLSFELPGALDCSVTDDSVTYSYRIGDNEVTLGAGVNRVDGGWIGSISLTVYDPSAEPGPIAYYPAPGDQGVLDESLFTIDGDSVMYRGPMLKQPANDGSQPAPIDVGTGTVVASC